MSKYPIPTISDYLWRSVNNSPLIVFRLLFGLIMAGQIIYSFFNGWICQTFITQSYNFTFIGFEWLNILHGRGMYFYFGLVLLLALLVSAGLLYRFVSLLLAILWTAVYLSSKIEYNNHYYLLVLLCWLMAAMPAAKRFSLDVKLGMTTATSQCYRWQIGLFILQVGCVYFFAGIAKINSDWLHCIPLTNWLQGKTGTPIIGRFLRNPAMPWLLAYGGLLFDLLVVPGLLYHKTRKWFFMLTISFHVFNGLVFKIGSFPFLGISLCVFFFPAILYDRFLGNRNLPVLFSNFSKSKRQFVNVGVAIYVVFQLFLPLRHWLIPGAVAWTEEGHRMAWQMMLRSKRGSIFFKIKDKKNDSTWIIPPTLFTRPEAAVHFATLPDLAWQAAQFLKEKYAKDGLDVAVYAYTNVSLNYRPAKPLIDTTTDLAGTHWNYFGHNKWILPGQ